MCGIVGFLGGRWGRDAQPEVVLERMADAIAHRGPDDAGYWTDHPRRIALGHRRLSIQDISSAGHQPMSSASSRYTIVYNGEIYNHWQLRDLLENAGRAPAWRSSSDTETLLAGFDAWGIQGTLERSNGMFAFAVWDKHTGTLFLARDRIGEKPLYYGWQGRAESSVFLFGSELTAFRAHPAFENTINRGAVSLQLRYGYVPAPYSIYEGIAKLKPGCLLSLSLDRREPTIWSYWSAAQVAETGSAQRFSGSTEQAVDALELLLRDSVRQRMLADVPVGAFLSGGVDSATVASLMQTESSRPVKTFTIGFHDKGYDEAKHAKAISRHLGTEHTELYVTADQAMDVIQHLPTLYSEPFSDSSQIPTFLVSQLARQHVTVSLSGDGGDELFCGYRRYHAALNMWGKMARLPAPLRNLVATGITGISPQLWSGLADRIKLFLPHGLRNANVGHRLHKGAEVLKCKSIDDVYLRLVSQWENPAAAIIGGVGPSTLMTGNAPPLQGLDAVQRMMALDLIAYLPDDILTKIDRAAMGVSLETRVPFLDHRVVEFAWSLPQSMKVQDGQTKWALRQVLFRHVPRELIERPKMGFGVPIADWLRGRLREWAESLLDESRLRHEGFFEPALVREKWTEHLSGERNWQRELWGVLMFQLWLEHQSAQAIPPLTDPRPHLMTG